MRTKTEILADIRKAPAVDAFRLEYADAIEAKDPAHSRYIRQQVRASLPGGPSADHAERLEERISHPIRQLCYDTRFHRGFVEEITIDPYVFIDRGHELLEIAPIQRVIFSPKPLPPELDPPLRRTVAPSPIPELMACPLLEHVYSVGFSDTHYQRWFLDADDIERVLTSRYLSQLLQLTFPDPGKKFEAVQCHEFWARAFARPEFRKMLTLGLPGYPGEGVREFDEGVYGITEVSPMPEEGRAFEREHGYLPSLHQATRWGTLEWWTPHDWQVILAAQRGELPKFPVGAPVTDEMYVPPPRKRRQNLFE